MSSVRKNQKTIPEVINAELEMIGYQQITSLATAQTLTLPTNFSPVEAMIVAETQDVRWRCDGTAPTASVGMPLPAGQALILRGEAALTVFKVIEHAATAKLNISYWA
jgi:hypothetical protein